jgi:hypothetical protein
MSRCRVAATSGMIAPIVFVTVFTIEGWLRPGYRAKEMFVSELSLGSHGWIQICNFVVVGILFLEFARGVAREFRKTGASRVGRVLLTLVGIGILASGPFVVDAASTPPSQMTWHSKLHWNVFGALVFSLSPISCFVFLRRFCADPAWRAFTLPTLVAGVITTAAVVLMAVGPTRPPAGPNAWNAWNGAIQRSFLVAYLTWIFLFARRVRMLCADSDRRRDL